MYEMHLALFLKAGCDTTLDLPRHLRPVPSLTKLVTPTVSTLVQDNISLIPSLVFHLASIHLGRGTRHKIH
jgi:hypothetical protein